jgi:plastocyanin
MRRFAIAVPLVALGAAAVVAVPAAQGASQTVKMDNFSFSPKTVKVDKGDKVKLKSTKGDHTFTVDKLGIDEVVDEGEKGKAKGFDEKGKFNLVCTFHEAEGMTGKVKVK